MIGVYMNTQLTYMLQDENYFDIDKKVIGQKVAELTIYSLPVSMITTFFISYIFEILGRRNTLCLSYFFTAIVLFIFPRTAPHYNYLILMRCLIAMTMSAPI